MSRLSVPVTAGDHAQGDANAPVTLVEYGDYQCPHCRIADVVVKRVQQHFGSKLRFVYRNFPLEMHPEAEPAAEAAESAGEQGRFWEMHDAIFKNQKTLEADMLPALAESLGLDGSLVETAVAEQRYLDRIEEEMEGGVRSGVHGTPTFFINGELHAGSFEFEELVRAVEAA